MNKDSIGKEDVIKVLQHLVTTYELDLEQLQHQSHTYMFKSKLEKLSCLEELLSIEMKR